MLDVPLPAAPSATGATQVGDQFKVTWTPAPTTAAVLTSSTVIATPVGSSAPVLTTAVAGPGTSGYVGPLQPQTTYRVTVVNDDGGGASPASAPVTVATPVSTVVPSAPGPVSLSWTAPQQPGDALLATWAAPAPGDSPIDSYQVNAGANDSGGVASGPYTQTVDGATFSTSFVLDDTFDWSVQVRAHNQAGWGPWSAVVLLPAA